MNEERKVIHEITPLMGKDVLYIADRQKKEFTYPIHNHAVYELNYVEHAAGVRRIVGDSTEVIGDFDLVLITSADLEHVWEQNICQSENIREITVQFDFNMSEDDLLGRNPFESIRRMMNEAKKGLCFPLRTLATSSYAKISVEDDSRRILKVKNYINKYYMDEIRLATMADMAGMSPSAFSRFFKLHTGRNLIDYIIDIRLGYASRMLVDTAESISKISFECGFNNLSNFNRVFKRKKGCSPSEFRENYRKTKVIV